MHAWSVFPFGGGGGGGQLLVTREHCNFIFGKSYTHAFNHHFFRVRVQHSELHVHVIQASMVKGPYIQEVSSNVK